MSVISEAGGWPNLHEGHGRVLRELIVHGPDSRVDIARKLGLSRTSLTRLVRELVDVGFMVEGEPQYTASRGRPAELVHLRPESAHFLGVKLTQDHVYVVVTDFSANVVAEYAERLTTREPSGVADQIEAIGRRLLVGRSLPAAMGVCLPGTVIVKDGRWIVEQSGFLGWNQVPLGEMLETRLIMPITLMNDVVALTVWHHWFGVGIGSSSLVVFGVGAGIGAGLVVHDEVLTGARGRAGHVGHGRLEGQGRRCGLGHDDCVHAFAPMGAIVHNADAEDYRSALARAWDGEPRALEAFRLAASAVGVAIAEAVNAIDPEQVLVTGEGTDMAELASEALYNGMADRLEQTDPSTVAIAFPDFSFTHYARGAAIAAVRNLV